MTVKGITLKMQPALVILWSLKFILIFKNISMLGILHIGSAAIFEKYLKLKAIFNVIIGVIKNGKKGFAKFTVGENYLTNDL